MDPHDTDPLDKQSQKGATSECEEALNTLYAFLDGELTTDKRQAIQHHLDECSPCLEAYDFEAELKVVIARKCRDRVPEGLRARVESALHQAHQGGEGSSGT